MYGLNCRSKNSPYVTAYEIALKHGFKGTEAEWIATIGCIYLARVNRKTGADWDCSDTFAELLKQHESKELHLATLDGKIAFLNGIEDNKITFCTTSYESDAGTVYDRYVMHASGYNDFEVVDVSNETGTITLDRLAAGIQTSLGKADSAYQKPGGGIPRTDLKLDVEHDIHRAPIIYIELIKDGGDILIDFDNTDLRGYETPYDAYLDDADVRIRYSPDGIGNPVVTHPCLGLVNGGHAILFGGVEEYTDFDSYTQKIAFYALPDNSPIVDYIEKPILEKISTIQEIQYYDVVVSDAGGGGFTCDRTFAQITAANDAHKIIRFFYKTFLGSTVEIGENAAFFYALDVTTPATPKLYLFAITGTGATGEILLS